MVHVWGEKRWRNNEEKNQNFTQTNCSARARLDCADQAASQQLTTCLSLVGVKFLAEGGWNKVSCWHRYVDWHLFPALIWENSDWLMCRYALQALKPRSLLLYPPAPAAWICLSLFGAIFHIGGVSKPLCDFEHCCDRKGAVVVTEVNFFLFVSSLVFSFCLCSFRPLWAQKNQPSSSIITDPQDLCAQLIPV